MLKLPMAACISLIGIIGLAGAMDCGGTTPPVKYSGLRVFTGDSAVGFVKKRLAVDADGAPNSYLVDGNGLSRTCDGMVALVHGKPSTPENDKDHWFANCKTAWSLARATENYKNLDIFGFATDRTPKNAPLIQKAGDPFPGTGFISETSVPVPEGPPGTQRHWVDATQIPYIVLSSSFLRDFAIKPGDVAAVYRPSNNRVAFAVYADGGNLGEGSVRLHSDLGNNSIVKESGVERASKEIDGEPILTVVFPGKTTHAVLDSAKWRDEIMAAGKAALAAWGGEDRLKACVVSP